MNKLAVLLTGLIVGVTGCAEPFPPAQVLRLKEDPPMKPRWIQEGPPADEEAYRSYISYDLNQDGQVEYFLPFMYHAHEVTFVLVDKDGWSLLWPRVDDLCDYGSFGCSQLVILNSRHEGYFDILAISTNLCDRPAETWQLLFVRDGRYEMCDWNKGLLFTPHGFRLGRPDHALGYEPQDVNPFSFRAFWSIWPIWFATKGPVLKPVPAPPSVPLVPPPTLGGVSTGQF